MVKLCSFPQFASLKVGECYLFRWYNGQSTTTSATASSFLFRSKTPTPLTIGTGNAWGLRTIRSVVLTEAKTMYAGGCDSVNNSFTQIHTMAYNTGTGL